MLLALLSLEMTASFYSTQVRAEDEGNAHAFLLLAGLHEQSVVKPEAEIKSAHCLMYYNTKAPSSSSFPLSVLRLCRARPWCRTLRGMDFFSYSYYWIGKVMHCYTISRGRAVPGCKQCRQSGDIHAPDSAFWSCASPVGREATKSCSWWLLKRHTNQLSTWKPGHRLARSSDVVSVPGFAESQGVWKKKKQRRACCLWVWSQH